MNLKVKSCGVCSCVSGFICRIRLCGCVYGCVNPCVWMCESVRMDVWIRVYGCVNRRVWMCESVCMDVWISVYGSVNRHVWMCESACMDVWIGVYGCVNRRVWTCESVARSFLSSGFSAECAHQFVDSFTWWWTSGLFSAFSNFEWSHSEHSCTDLRVDSNLIHG